jgi:hypothetical protein
MPSAYHSILWTVYPPGNTLSNTFTYTWHIDYLLADMAPTTGFCLINIRSNLELYFCLVWHYCKQIEDKVLFYWLFLEVFITLVVIKPVITLALCEYTNSIQWRFNSVLTSSSLASISSTYSIDGFTLSLIISSSSSNLSVHCHFPHLFFALGPSEVGCLLLSSLLSVACLLRFLPTFLEMASVCLVLGGEHILGKIPLAALQVTVPVLWFATYHGYH